MAAQGVAGSSMHSASSELLMAREDSPALGDIWTSSSSTGTAECWLGLLAVVPVAVSLVISGPCWHREGGATPKGLDRQAEELPECLAWVGGRCKGHSSASFCQAAATSGRPHTGPQMCHLGPDAVLGSLPFQHGPHLVLLYELAARLPFLFLFVRC